MLEKFPIKISKALLALLTTPPPEAPPRTFCSQVPSGTLLLGCEALARLPASSCQAPSCTLTSHLNALCFLPPSLPLSPHPTPLRPLPDQKLNDIVGSAYYIAPEVLHRTYGTEADLWSLGVTAYILLSGTRPFWAKTESGVFRAVLRHEPAFSSPAWQSLPAEAALFVRELLVKDFRRRLTAAQALRE